MFCGEYFDLKFSIFIIEYDLIEIFGRGLGFIWWGGEFIKDFFGRCLRFQRNDVDDKIEKRLRFPVERTVQLDR